MISEFDSQFTKLTGAKQSMSSWAQVIETYDALPEIYQDPFKRIMGNFEAFPYVVLMPSLAGMTGKPTTEKVLIQSHAALHILERIGHSVHTLGFALDDVIRLEYGNILLYSWITLQGVSLEGISCAVTIEFNTASLSHLLPLMRAIRLETLEGDQNTLEIERSRLAYLEADAYKFMNFARESLLPGECVIRTIWQPSLYRPVFKRLLLPIKRTVALSHLLILTDKEFILIRDDPRSLEYHGARYGGIWEYMPVHKITSISIEEKDPGFCRLSLRRAPLASLEIYFDDAKRQDLARLQQDFEQMGIPIL